MSVIKLRRLLVSVHLILAAFLTPAFILVAVTGGLELADIEGKLEETPLSFPDNVGLDFKDPDLEEAVDALLETQGISIRFEGLRVRGDKLTTVPTTRPFVRLQTSTTGVTGTLQTPDLQYTLMELHKGHGPLAFQWYQIASAIALCLIIIGGVAIGLITPAYRKLTLGGLALGAGSFILLALM